MAFDRRRAELGSAVKIRLTDACPRPASSCPRVSRPARRHRPGIARDDARARRSSTTRCRLTTRSRTARSTASGSRRSSTTSPSATPRCRSPHPRRPGGRFHWSTLPLHRLDLRRHDADSKTEILEGYEAKAAKVQTQYERGLITDDERRQELIEIWTQASNQVAKEMETNFPRTNPIYRMVSSGAGGNWMQIRQIAGMRGLMANPKGEIIPRPIKANFREGLTVLEFFISTHGARKGLADTALRTADSGYLTSSRRRLAGRHHP